MSYIETLLALTNNQKNPNSFSAAFETGIPSGFNYNPQDVFGSVLPALNNTPFSGGNMAMLSMLPGGNGGGSWFDFGNFLPWKDASGASGMGWGMPLLGMGKSIFDGWLGMEKLDLAKDSLNFQKDAFSKQFENQRTLTNAELRDRQRARVASNPTAYQSVDEYMKANQV